MDFGSIEQLVAELMEKEDRKDVEFRHIIAVTEVGDIGKYITHDPKLNPNARPHGTKEDEILAYGHAFVQLAALAGLRGVRLSNAWEKGLQNWADRDWKKAAKQMPEKKTLKGIPASPGYASDIAEVVTSISEIKRAGSILVVRYATPEFASVLKNYSACISDHGGKTCHLANIAREANIPCVVGTGNATELIKTGMAVSLDGDKGEVYLE
ncbi:MAG: PEP-utilizing enzyme [Nanoarchaeota archaeon]|nr:PEP-utilizing enzyme [Nanoarchaeota archaeon]